MEHHFNSPINGPGKYDQAGFTMIEVLIAMGLFMIGILSLTGLQAACMSGNASARIQTEATAIGAQVIEELRMLPEDHPDLDADGNPHELSRAGSHSYTVRWIVTDNVAVSETKSVRVTVLPDNRVNGRPVTMGTLLAR